MASTRPSHLRWGPIGLVIVGGALGAAAREAVSLLIPNLGVMPIAIPVVNVVGAFLLGYLYEALTRDTDTGRVANLKLLIGTGFCGGFTTYSSLATDTAVLNANGHLGLAFVYSLGTVVLGALATWAGIVIASRANARHQHAKAPAETVGR